jgi:hypothetical protein
MRREASASYVQMRHVTDLDVWHVYGVTPVISLGLSDFRLAEGGDGLS